MVKGGHVVEGTEAPDTSGPAVEPQALAQAAEAIGNLQVERRGGPRAAPAGQGPVPEDVRGEVVGHEVEPGIRGHEVAPDGAGRVLTARVGHEGGHLGMDGEGELGETASGQLATLRPVLEVGQVAGAKPAGLRVLVAQRVAGQQGGS